MAPQQDNIPALHHNEQENIPRKFQQHCHYYGSEWKTHFNWAQTRENIFSSPPC
jgi:hypothetical protein